MTRYLNRKTGQVEKEDVYFEELIRLLYGDSFLSKTIGWLFLHGLAKWPLFSSLFGYLQTWKSSKKKIAPFIDRFRIDCSEFQKPATAFSSFNDFFIRSLKPECRPIAPGKNVAIMPADGRYTISERIGKDDCFTMKGETFCLASLLQDEEMAKTFENGSALFARLCPTDCHRFYFPISCTPTQASLIHGKLFSVHPIATKDNPKIFLQNRRTVTYLHDTPFGDIAYLEIGATNVGSITQTYTPNTFVQKGAEKGYFSFGASALILLFQEGRIAFCPDLLKLSKMGLEIRCLIGQELGTANA
jgi:phosphatidylserine decarboxylase